MQEQSEIVKSPEDPTFLERVGEAIIVPLVLAIIAVGFAGVCLRYVFNGHYALFWSEEVIRYAFIWVFWLCAPILVWRRAMFSVDVFVNMMPKAIQRMIAIVLDLAVIGLMGTFVYYGWLMARVNAPQHSSALSISLFWIYLAIPVGSAFIILATITRMGRDWRSGRQEAGQ
ncbi:TRAP transporter small permease [Pseudorhizobium marinum]|jgi:TRAP-type C4-dicarboxylate transport system permease small subunit|uniref:TRAP transporter small permease n=1 Tax=Pseudorhizobium marinum TaxID=1496690 RepID=UPI000494E0CB|nr:TRAP transporter small permease [Pseudorhizobium marinum]MBU1314733.1 TRAP transporter small permease [Alphaproteobacteria bacterium]MBU1551291.1 TRAP transporter small permease [Alphaproteobacteria bacterium]MBU2334774.1 TRAP transporter small permease [Alphaproteobacteria bacterium]MBU2389277.1 TRAP transporter small permease [Alphaproteobacteria bacterium]